MGLVDGIPDIWLFSVRIWGGGGEIDGAVIEMGNGEEGLFDTGGSLVETE